MGTSRRVHNPPPPLSNPFFEAHSDARFKLITVFPIPLSIGFNPGPSPPLFPMPRTPSKILPPFFSLLMATDGSFPVVLKIPLPLLTTLDMVPGP